MASFESLQTLPDDGLSTPVIGAWGEEKYRHVELYAALFVKSMHAKWNALVYLDLFAGSGRSRIRGTNRIVNSSLLVLGLSVSFDKYIFCEGVHDNVETLKKRCDRDFPMRYVTVVPGDANASVDKIIAVMPAIGRNQKVLGFCFLDPFQMQNLRFSTIRRLSERFMDFLVLIPSSMDANRNERHYVQSRNKTLDNFVGNSVWRIRWEEEKPTGKSFEHFVVEEFGRSMESLGYIDPGLKEARMIRSNDKYLSAIVSARIIQQA